MNGAPHPLLAAISDEKEAIALGGVLLAAMLGAWAVTAPDAGAGSEAPETPPDLLLSVGDETVQGVAGSYCWTGRCVDRVGPTELAATTDLSTATIAPYTRLQIVADGYRTPRSVSWTIMDANGTRRASGDTAAFAVADLPPGPYLLVGSARWDAGDTSTVFRIRVTR